MIMLERESNVVEEGEREWKRRGSCGKKKEGFIREYEQ